MALSPLDHAIQSTCPTEIVPHVGELPPLAGHKRLLLASDGVYLDCANAALQARVRLSALSLPYGATTPFLHLPHGPLPRALLQQALAAAAATPIEVAFGLQHDEDDGYVLIQPPVTSASRSHVSYEDALDDQRLIVDLHSHGQGRAFFSATDDASDLARVGPYLAVVVGRADTAPEIAVRLVCPPFLIPLSLDDLRPLFA